MNLLTFGLLIISIIMTAGYYITSVKLSKMTFGFAQLFKDYVDLAGMVDSENNTASKSEEDIHQENFIKFLSDSRDWAFDYIDNVQSGLRKFITEIEPHIEYYNKFGAVVENMVAPHDSALKTISKELEELKKLIPEDTNDRR